MSVAVVLDAGSLASLDALAPEGVDRVVLAFQASPMRRAALGQRFAGAEIVDVPPAGNGPWVAVVERDLASLLEAGPVLHGVPLLDVFLAAWREEASRIRALEFGLHGSRRVRAVAGSTSASLLEGVRRRGGIDDLEVVPGSRVGTERASLLHRIARAGPRGIALALESRVDPSHVGRAFWRKAPHVEGAKSLLVASYVNATRAALEAHDALGGGPALLLRSGPGALGALTLPPEVASLSLSQAVALDRPAAKAALEEALSSVESALRTTRDDPWHPAAAIGDTSFGRALFRAVLPEVATAVVAVRALLEKSRAKRLLVGDEFSWVDRAAVHAARSLGIETVSRQHGVLDSHYRRERILCARHLAWDEATVHWLTAKGAIPPATRVETSPRRLAPVSVHRDVARDVVVFLQPFEMTDVPLGDWMEETLGAVVRATEGTDGRVLVKPHPLQTRAGIEALVPEDVRAKLELVTDRTARELLATARAAVTLDSSVAVDCREAGVPCFSTAWYRGTYAPDLAVLGYVVPCPDPDSLERALRPRGAAVPSP